MTTGTGLETSARFVVAPGASVALRYASAGVPVYVIGDREHGEVRMLSRPERGEYRNVSTHKPGETLELPGDFAAEIPVDVMLQR